MSTLYERREYVGDDGVSRIYMMVDYVPFAFVTGHIKDFPVVPSNAVVMHIHNSVSAIRINRLPELKPPPA